MHATSPDTPAIVDALLENDFDPVAAAGALGVSPMFIIEWHRSNPAAQQALADIEALQVQLARLQALKYRRAAVAELHDILTDPEATRPERLRAAITLAKPDRSTKAPAPIRSTPPASTPSEAPPTAISHQRPASHIRQPDRVAVGESSFDDEPIRHLDPLAEIRRRLPLTASHHPRDA